MASSTKPIVLHIGDPIKYNPATHALLASHFTVVRPDAADRERPAFLAALRQRKWGDFHAIMRPFWGTGGEMGKWDDELIALLPPTVKVFASAGAGFDWADTELLGKRGIIYCNGGLAAAESVADFAVAMVISTFRHLPWLTSAALVPYLTSQPASSFSSSTSQQQEAAAEKAFMFAHTHATAHSHNPRSHVLGLVGLGKIGQLIAAKLGNPASFGMRVHYHDVERKSGPVEKAAFVEAYHDSLADLLTASDAVVLCTPASPDGRPLVTREALAHCKPGGQARFVNIARGLLVDEDALADALEQGILGSAALDVHADEPRVNKRLLALAGTALARPGELDAQGKGLNPGRVMLTCHNAGGTVETHIGFEELAMRNVLAVLGGQAPITPVNLHFLNKKESRL